MEDRGHLLSTIRQWQSRLTGLPELSFEGHTFIENMQFVQQWHASKTVAEHMVFLTIMYEMLKDDLGSRDIASYLAADDMRKDPLGGWGIITGLTETPSLVERIYMPLLEGGGYRPFLRPDVIKAIVNLCSDPVFASAQLSAASIADALYQRRVTPRSAKTTISTVRRLSDHSPTAAVTIMEDLAAVRGAAEDTVVNLPDIAERIDEASPDIPFDDGADGSDS